MTDLQRVQERDGKVVAAMPCDCRLEVVLGRAEVRLPSWQACPRCERRWRLYVLGSDRALWVETCAEVQPVRPRRGMRGWRR